MAGCIPRCVTRQRRILNLVCVKLHGPRIPDFLSSRADAVLEMVVYAIGNQEFRILGPAIIALGEPDFLFPERLAVSGSRVLLVRRTPSDVAIHDNERGAFGGLQERAEAAAD